jgi:hypothetical protein
MRSKNDMRAYRPAGLITSPLGAAALVDQPSATQRLLNPLLELAQFSDHLVGGSVGQFLAKRSQFQLPRFIFMGPTGGGDTIRLGIFAGLHADDQIGAEALVAFLQELEAAPSLAKDYHLYTYPICNPVRFAGRLPGGGADRDLAGGFWNGSSQPEVYYLERELGVHRFQGVISLATRNDAGGFRATTNSAVLDRALAQPAMQATQRFLPGNLANPEPPAGLPPAELQPPRSDFLTATDELSPVPFELQLDIPKQSPQPSQIHGTVGALKSILDSYRILLSIGQNL